MNEFRREDGPLEDELAEDEPAPHQNRVRRQEEGLRREADEAAAEGSIRDGIGEITEHVLSTDPDAISHASDTLSPPSDEVLKNWPELAEGGPELVTNLAMLERDIRYLLAFDGDVMDAGSFDSYYMQKLGLDVCTNPGILILLKERAKKATGKESIKLDEMVKERQELEVEMMKREKTSQAVKHLVELGVDEDELLELMHVDPFRLRSYSRLLSEPVLARFVSGVREAVSQGAMYSLDALIAEAMVVVSANSTIHAAMAEGDPRATALYLQELRRMENSQALLEVAERGSVESREPDIPSPRFPDTQAEFTDIPRFPEQ